MVQRSLIDESAALHVPVVQHPLLNLRGVSILVDMECGEVLAVRDGGPPLRQTSRLVSDQIVPGSMAA